MVLLEYKEIIYLMNLGLLLVLTVISIAEVLFMILPSDFYIDQNFILLFPTPPIVSLLMLPLAISVYLSIFIGPIVETLKLKLKISDISENKIALFYFLLPFLSFILVFSWLAVKYYVFELLVVGSIAFYTAIISVFYVPFLVFIVYDRFIYNFVWHEGEKCARFLFFNSWLFILLLLVEILARPESLGSYFLHFHIMVLLYPYLQDFGWVINGFIESELPEARRPLKVISYIFLVGGFLLYFVPVEVFPLQRLFSFLSIIMGSVVKISSLTGD